MCPRSTYRWRPRPWNRVLSPVQERFDRMLDQIPIRTLGRAPLVDVPMVGRYSLGQWIESSRGFPQPGRAQWIERRLASASASGAAIWRPPWLAPRASPERVSAGSTNWCGPLAPGPAPEPALGDRRTWTIAPPPAAWIGREPRGKGKGTPVSGSFQRVHVPGIPATARSVLFHVKHPCIASKASDKGRRGRSGRRFGCLTSMGARIPGLRSGQGSEGPVLVE